MGDNNEELLYADLEEIGRVDIIDKIEAAGPVFWVIAKYINAEFGHLSLDDRQILALQESTKLAS